MKSSLLASVFICLSCLACDNERIDKQKNETPAALTDATASYALSSSRGYNDLVESLYNELTDKSPGLKKLETELDLLAKTKGDSTELVDKYDEKNKSYYSSARNHVEQVKDSVLRNKIRNLVAQSLINYTALVADRNAVLKTIALKETTLSDLHTVLKITETLPLMKKFQQDKLPATKPLKNYASQLDETIKYADSLLKK